MIPIDTRKLELPRTVDVERCEDGSVRIIKYTTPEPPKELLTMGQGYGYGYSAKGYTLTVHLPEQRKADIVATVAHTSVNCWKVTVSSLGGSSCISYKTLGEVNELLKGLFA